MYIDSQVQALIEYLKGLFLTVGTEPVSGSWDTIEEQNKYLYDKIIGLNPYVDCEEIMEYHTNYESYPLPVNTADTLKPLAVKLINTKPYVLYNLGSTTHYNLWNPSESFNMQGASELTGISTTYRLIDLYDSGTDMRLVFIKTDTTETLERIFDYTGYFLRDEIITGYYFNSYEIDFKYYSTFKCSLGIKIGDLQFNYPDNYLVGLNTQGLNICRGTSKTYVSQGEACLFLEDDAISKIVYLDNSTYIHDYSNNFIGSVWDGTSIWALKQKSLVRYKCI
jgi:hypothetical protein